MSFLTRKLDMPPYIGISGFVHRTEVDMALTRIPSPCTRKLMVGVLANSQTLEKPETNPNRYPRVQQIEEIFSPDPRVLNLLHYTTADPNTLKGQLEKILIYAGPYLQGIQLNMAWPEAKHLMNLVGLRVVLQIGNKALEKVDHNYRLAALKINAYKGIVTDVLIDQSGGQGVPLNVAAMTAFAQILQEAHPTLGIGVAGGLCAETLGSLNPLLMKFPQMSIDAEGKLRNEHDHLDFPKMKAYLDVALDICKSK